MVAAAPPHRSGVVLVIVLGLITIMLSLLLSVTVVVFTSIRSGPNVQQNAQAVIMAQAARLWIKAHVGDATNYAGILDPGICLGDEAVIPGKPMSHRLGWVYLRKGNWQNPVKAHDDQYAKTGLGSAIWVLGAGGGSANTGGVAGKTSAMSGDPVANAYEIRYLYTWYQIGSSPSSYGNFSLMPYFVAPDHYAGIWHSASP